MKTIQGFLIIFSVLLYLSTQHPLFVLANVSTENPNPVRGNESDYEALLAIKTGISIDPNSVLSSWNNTLHFCQWQGISCGRKHRRVVSLSLGSSNLVGTLSPSIGNLSFLRELSLSNNSFRGNIPHQIGDLPRLQRLLLASNNFEGEIPTKLSRCLSLNKLDLKLNKLVGNFPTELATLSNLTYVDLSHNNLYGEIGNMSTSLLCLILSNNNLQGMIPHDIGRLKSLQYLTLGDNLISGPIPSSFYNLSSLQVLDLRNNEIHGHLPNDIGLRLPLLYYLSIENNSFSGQVPNSLSNLSGLVSLDISYNSFTGRFPFNGNNLPQLECLHIEYAFTSGQETRDLSFLDTLKNCTMLQHLFLGGNSFTGTFPHSIRNLSSRLLMLDLRENQLFGQLPFWLGEFVSLLQLYLSQNHFIGRIPFDIGNLKALEFLYLNNNFFSHEIPSSLGNLTKLSILSMKNNNLQGSIPSSLGKCTYLQYLYLSSNKLSGVLPVELFHASSLIHLVVYQNNLNGTLPAEVSMLKNLVLLDISQNRFSGEIPSTLGACTSLTTLNMSENSFTGSIPDSMCSLKSIQNLNLSHNNLSGQIPSKFSSWSYLVSLNLSFNSLEGEVPSNGVFANSTVVSLAGNNKLCGGILALRLPKCTSSKESRRIRLSLAMIAIILLICLLVIVISLAFCIYLVCSPKKRKVASPRLKEIKPFLEMSYQMLSKATDGFSSSNLIGVGGFGSVYKGILDESDQSTAVAVKVMNLTNERASKSFIAECNALRNIRHRNLVKIITVCSSINSQYNDFKALVYEFIPGGSLESWLHSTHLTSQRDGDEQSCTLTLSQRLSIAIDVASALEYLHIEYANPIIHCDLKPTNILLDDELIAHVGDFGLAKNLSGAATSDVGIQSSSTQVRGTVGYAAPEYGLGSNVSMEGDMYSFGIIILEMMTSKKPTDPMFSDGLNLHDYAKSALPNRVLEIVDQRMLNMLHGRTDDDLRKIECIKSLIMIGVQCSLEVPRERMNIKDVVNELKSVMHNL